MELLQDFRLRCLKANNLVKRISEGMLPGICEEDSWFSDNSWAKIESFRAVIQQQLVQIDRLEATAGESRGDSVLESTEEFDEIKIEPVEIQDEADESDLEREQTLHSVMKFESSVESHLSCDELAIEKTCTGLLKCKKCGQSYTTYDGVKQHLLSCDGTFNAFTCNLCEATFTEHNLLVTHVVHHCRGKHSA